MKTSIGCVDLILSRMKCTACKKTFSPMMRLFDVDPFSRKSREFEKLTLEIVANQSFRRSAKNLNDTMGFSTVHTTLHRWFTNTDAVNMNQQMRVGDGTGFKKEKDGNGAIKKQKLL